MRVANQATLQELAEQGDLAETLAALRQERSIAATIK